MTAAPNSPLVKRVAEAIRDRAIGGAGMTEYASERYAEAALAACEFEAMRESLRSVLHWTKNIGQSKFRSKAHFDAFCDAYMDASALLARLDAKP